MRIIFRVLIEIGDDTENWEARKVWLNGVLNELWKARGPYPGFASAMMNMGIESLVQHYVSLTNEGDMKRFREEVNRLVDLRSEINAAIESMENPEERLLLKYRYLKNESWEDISYELNVSYRTVHRIHASSLNNFVVPE